MSTLCSIHEFKYQFGNLVHKTQQGYLLAWYFVIPHLLTCFSHFFVLFWFGFFPHCYLSYIFRIAPRSPDKEKTCVLPLWGIFCLLHTALWSYHRWSFTRIQIFLCTCSSELDTWVSAWHPWLSHHLGFSVILFCSVLENLSLASSIAIPLPTFMLRAWVGRKMFFWDRILGIGRNGHDKFRDKK